MLYIDDGQSLDYQNGNYLLIEFNFENNILSSKYVFIHFFLFLFPLFGYHFYIFFFRFTDAARFGTTEFIEKIVFVGLKKAPSKIETDDIRSVEFKYDASKQLLVLRKPTLALAQEWILTLKM